MRVCLLGTAAGGGFPQWNCNCANCRGLRSGSLRVQARTQSCVALSADEQHWFLLNVSPDVRTQMEAFPPLWPPAASRRGTGVDAILLTDADLDHTLGLFILREGLHLTVYATAPVQHALNEGLMLAPVLSHYCQITWREPAYEPAPLLCADGSASGLYYRAIPLAGKPPRYMEDRSRGQLGDRVGYYVVDERTGGRLLYVPGLASFEESLQPYLRSCDALLLDGTFWSEQALEEQGVGTTPASHMGHLPISGPRGSLVQLAGLPIQHIIYTHINNTNPILIEDSPQHAAVCAAGIEIGRDGLELNL